MKEEDKILSSLQSIPRATSLARRAGVERIVLSNNLGDKEVDDIIRTVVRELAAQGKRISLFPKRLPDGLAVDWFLDRSVKQEDVETILRRVVPGLKVESPSHQGPQTPIIIDSDDDEVAIPAPPQFSHIPSSFRQTSEPVMAGPTTSDYRRYASEQAAPMGRRRRAASGGQFTLTNLAHNTRAEEVLLSLEGRGVPKDAVSEIRIRTAPIGTVATVYLAMEFDAVALERKVRGADFGVLTSRQSLSSLDRPAAVFPDHRRGSINALLKAEPTDDLHSSGQLVVIDLVSNESAPEPMGSSVPRAVDEDEVLATTLGDINGPAEAQDSIPHDDPLSPALSYLTLEEPLSDVEERGSTEGEQAAREARQQTLSPWSRLRALPSSDQDSDDDMLMSTDVGNSKRPAFQDASDDSKGRLLTGEISNVRTFLQTASAEERRYMRVLSRSNPSSPRRSRRFPTSGSSEGNSDSDVGVPPVAASTSNAKRQNPLRCLRGKESPKHPSRRVPSGSTLARPIPASDDNISVTLPKAEHAKSRRLILPPDSRLPITAVYMRGDCQFIHQQTREHIAQFSLPSEKSHRDAVSRHVVDAHLLDDKTIVIGYDRGPSQVSCVIFDTKRPKRVDIPYRGHTTVAEHRRTGTSSPNPGISSMAAMSADNRHRFLSGGGDGTVRIWTLSRDSDQGRNLRAASEHLAFSPRHPVRCLAYRSFDKSVFVCHTRHIFMAHLEIPRPATMAHELSAAPQQVHIHPQNPHVVALEVDHLDHQVQIFDIRRPNFGGKAVMEFGYRSARSMGTKHIYRKGSTSHALFARGYSDGTLCVWDFRNTKNVVKKAQTREDPIVHTVLTGDQVIAYGSYKVTFWGLRDF